MGKEPVDHLQLARRALAEYTLKDPRLEFIQQSDSISYKVETPGEAGFLLRLHIPLTEAMGSHGADARAVNSELLWLEALCQDTDLILQKPIRNKQNALVTQIEAPGEIGTVNCTLLTWLAGERYLRDLETEHTAFQIGENAATLHNHASQWEIPAGFTRPKRDPAYFEKVLQGIQPAVADGRISEADYHILESSVHLLIEEMRGLSEDRHSYGITHADMHKGNLLIHQGRIRLIDFSFCAFSNFMFDPAICLSDMRPDLHQAFLMGYQSLRPLPSGYQRLVEGFFIGSMVGTFSFWVPNLLLTNLLVRKVPQIAQEYAVKYLYGDHFWF